MRQDKATVSLTIFMIPTDRLRQRRFDRSPLGRGHRLGSRKIPGAQEPQHLVLSFSPDGQRIASAAGVGGGGGSKRASDDGIRIWNVARVQPDVLTLRGKAGVQFSALAFSPDSGQLAAVGSDGNLKRWDVRSGQELDGPQSTAGPIACVAYDAIGRLMATGGLDGMVRFYNLDTGQPVRTLREPQGAIAALAFSPNGSSLASRSGSWTVRIWELSTGQPRLTLEGDDGFESGIAWSPDGNWVVAGNHDESLKLWNASTGRLLHTGDAHASRS